ncbi:MAG: ATP-binding cassette domain-containing protein [Dehalococcoidia bacterium]|nr:ATP-binding cassette domain-containing protein [Dehalococcoidia bacterium]
MATATALAAPLLEVRDVHVALGGGPVLAGAGVTVRAGEVVGLAGPNGAGKSTLLRAVTRVLRAERGTFLLRGTPIDARSRLDFAREVAVVQQLPEAPPTMRVEELVLLGRHPHLRLLGRESGRDRAIALDAMRRAGCDAFAERALGTLSGGERRRAFIARALAQEPRLLLLDEPTANLDAGAQGEVFELLRALAADGVGVLVVVHDLTLAASYCDRLVLMQRGRTVAEGPPAEVVTAETVRRVYGDRVTVVRHPSTGAPLVVPAVAGTEDRDA